jgi:hypothetical protein
MGAMRGGKIVIAGEAKQSIFVPASAWIASSRTRRAMTISGFERRSV